MLYLEHLLAPAQSRLTFDTTMHLGSKLEEWVQHGLLSAEQAQAVLRYEEQAPRRNWVLFGFVGIGIVALLTGIVSIVAANWDWLPPGLKLVTYFAAQSALGAALLRYAHREGVVREALLTSFALLFLAGIGLVGQLYNLRSDGWQGILFWLALILPVTLCARSRLINHLWFAGLALALGLWIESSGYNVRTEGYFRFLCVIGIAYLVFAVGLLHRAGLPAYFCAAARVWSGLFLLGVLPVYSNLLFADRPYELENKFETTHLLFPTLSLLFPVAVITGFGKRFERNVAPALTALVIALWAGVLIPHLVEVDNQHVLGCLAFLVSWTLAAVVAGFAKRKRLFDIATFVIAARFVVVYFEVFGSLTATGVGLIVSGAVIIGAAALWHRYRRRLRASLGMNL